MVSDIKNRQRSFAVKGKEYEIFFAEDGYVEIYETKNPGKTGFIFQNLKNFVLFINNITDIAESKLNEEEK
ncbi:MAG: hypothetical protein ACW98D_20425 [Promethearchaeota archaeon]|jgi:hypothetical protein